MIQHAVKKILAGENLSFDEATQAMDFIMDGNATDAQIAGLIISLKQKGETSDEVAGFVSSMRAHSNKIVLSDENAVDGCGTGGDGSNSFNVSTAAAIVTAAAGATVAKHGNRSVSSKCGSSDLLEKTGGKLDCSIENVEKIINDIGFGFMFAPMYHTAMKYAAGPRRDLGVRTVFNILGPMTNPAAVNRQVIGVYDKSLMPLMADVLRKTGSQHVIIAHGQDGMDEFSISTPTDYFELKDGNITQRTVSQDEVGLKKYDSNALIGGDAVYNLSILNDVLDGIKSAYRDAVLFNAGAMLYVASKSESIQAGVELASKAIDSKAAKEKLKQWVEATNS